MPETANLWQGDNWQKHCMLLLKRHYGPDKFQEIPDEDRGDCGLEGFSVDGCAYQCYAPQEHINKAKMRDDQKQKITRDVKKLITNKDKIIKLLDGVKIHTWILLVPDHASKELNIHATNKANEIRELNPPLPYIDEDFRVHIATDDFFSVERQQLVRAGCSEIVLLSDDSSVTDIDVSDWADENDKLVQVLEKKASKIELLKGPSKLHEFRNEMLTFYLKGQNVIEKLKRHYPDIYEGFRRCKKQREDELKLESLTPIHPPVIVFRDEITSFEKLLRSSVLGLGEQNVSILAREAIADWLLRCPLEFMDTAND